MRPLGPPQPQEKFTSTRQPLALIEQWDGMDGGSSDSDEDPPNTPKKAARQNEVVTPKKTPTRKKTKTGLRSKGAGKPARATRAYVAKKTRRRCRREKRHESVGPTAGTSNKKVASDPPRKGLDTRVLNLRGWGNNTSDVANTAKSGLIQALLLEVEYEEALPGDNPIER